MEYFLSVVRGLGLGRVAVGVVREGSPHLLLLLSDHSKNEPNKYMHARKQRIEITRTENGDY